MVYIVGLGPGDRKYMLYKAVAVLQTSDIIIGFKRALESLDFIEQPKQEFEKLSDILEFIRVNNDKNISIAASGDPCFYGISDYLKRNYSGNIEIVPGISSFQYLVARLNKSWQGAYLGSLHGREEAFIDRVRENKLSIWLTDKTNNPQAMCRKLYEEDLSVKVYVGENLSYKDEKITEGNPEKLMNMSYSDLSVVVIENEIY